MIDAAPAASSVLAFVTTVHAVLFLLRTHSERRAAKLWAVPSSCWPGDVGAEHAGVARGRRARGRRVVRGMPDPGAGSGCRARSGRSGPPVRAVARPRRTRRVARIRTLRLSRAAGIRFRGRAVPHRAGGSRRPSARALLLDQLGAGRARPPRDLGAAAGTRVGAAARHGHAGRQSSRARLRRAGSCTRRTSRRPIVLLAGGIGITPLIAMVRHAVAAEPAARSR